MDTKELRAKAEAAKAAGVYDPAREKFSYAASPSVILSLLDELERTRSSNEAMRKALREAADVLERLDAPATAHFVRAVLQTEGK